jgi:SAM-dependent methyltransferase
MPHWTETLFKEQADRYVDFFEQRFAAADAQAETLLDLVATEYGVEPETALDLACGTGRHVFAFADRGLDAEGLDFSEPFVERARTTAAERDLPGSVAFHEHDLRDLDEWTGSYDLVTSFWNSLGYYDRETDEQLLANARRLLSEEGVLVVEASNKDCYLANLEPASVSENGRLFVERRDYDVETGRFHTKLDRFDATGEGYEHEYSMEWENRIYAPAVLRELCEDAGFDDVRLFGGFDGGTVTLDSDSVVLLAQ